MELTIWQGKAENQPKKNTYTNPANFHGHVKSPEGNFPYIEW